MAALSVIIGALIGSIMIPVYVIRAIYVFSADTILGNCDTTLFLGGKEKTTLKEMSELLGKETIDLYNTSETRSNQKSFP